MGTREGRAESAASGKPKPIDMFNTHEEKESTQAKPGTRPVGQERAEQEGATQHDSRGYEWCNHGMRILEQRASTKAWVTAM